MKTHMYTSFKDAVSPTSDYKLNKIILGNEKVKHYLNHNGIHFPIDSHYFEQNINRLLPILNTIDNLILILVYKDNDVEIKTNCLSKDVNKTFKTMAESSNWLLKTYEHCDIDEKDQIVKSYKIYNP